MIKSNIFKKIAASIITLSMVIGAVPAMAAETSATTDAGALQAHEIELLKKLNIVTEDMSLRLGAEEEISRGVFSEMLTAMLGVGGGDNAIEELYNLGIVNGYGDGILKERQSITTYEAIKMLICALGYSVMAESEGGYPLGYVKVAYDIDLISGTIQNEVLTYDDAMKLMFDAGNTNTAVISNDYYLGGVELGGDTMFYTYFDVVKYTGVMTADGYTSLDGNDCLYGEVTIGGTTMEVGESNAKDYIGYEVEAYAYDRELIDEIVAIGPRAKYNKEVTILAGAYLETSGTLQSFEVKYEGANGKTAKLNVEDYYVVYNGKNYGGLTLDFMESGLADFTFIDNDRDNKYEIIKIDQYETYVVQSINTNTSTIYAKYGKELSVDPEKQHVYMYDERGKDLQLDDLLEGSVLWVAKSQDGKLVRAYLLDQSVMGSIDGMKTFDGHTVVTIAKNNYVITKEYENLSNADKIDPILGAPVKAFLDKRGNIVEMQSTSGVWVYGYIMKVGYDYSNEQLSTLSIFSQTNRRVDLVISDKISVDGITIKKSDLDTMGIVDMTGVMPRAIRQLVRYRATGTKLTHLDTFNNPYNPALEDVDALGATTATDVVAFTGRHNKATGYFLPYSGTEYVDGGVIVGIDNSSIGFRVPPEDFADDASRYETQMAGGFFSEGTRYASGATITYNAYNVNEAKIAKVILITYDSIDVINSQSQVQRTSPFLIYTGQSTEIDKASGEAALKVEGITPSTGAAFSQLVDPSNTIATNNANTFVPTLKFGDVIRYQQKTYPGVATYISTASNNGVSLENDTTALRERSDGAETVGTYMSYHNEYIGRIGWANATHMKLTNDDNTEEAYFTLGDAKVYLVDCKAETIETLPVTAVASYARDKIGEDSKTYVLQSEGTLVTIVIYKNISAR